MSDQPQDIQQWIRELISRSARDQMYNLQRFEELVRRITTGEIDQVTVRNEYLEFARQESTRYVRDLTRVGLSFYNTLLELNRQYNDRFYQQAYPYPVSPTGPAQSEAPIKKIVELELWGTLGEQAERGFVIENQRGQPVSVTFLISEFMSEDERAIFRPPVQISPARFSLRPGQERLVNLKISLLPEFFEIGMAYQALVVVSGFENLQLRLKVWAEAAKGRESPPAEEATTAGPGLTFLPVSGSQETGSQDLTRIKGIGLAYQQQLYELGIDTYARLASLPPTELVHKLGSPMAQRAARDQWLEQARFAAHADWSGLEAFQINLEA